MSKLGQSVIKTLPMAKLEGAEYNPRQISDAALAGLTSSLGEFGLVQPIVYNERTGTVVGGHQRLKALRSMGVQEVDCVVVNLPIEKEKALNVTLNNPAISGTFLEAELQSLLSQLESSSVDLEGLMLTELMMPEMEPLDDVDHSGEVNEEQAKLTISCPASDSVYLEELKESIQQAIQDHFPNASFTIR